MPEQNLLFSPTQLGDISINNRIIMAPMTRNRSAEGYLPQQMQVDYYRQRASSGLIITEATQVSEDAVGYPGTPGLYNKEQVEAWSKVTDAVHEVGGKIAVQLWYCGRISHPSLLPNNTTPVSASAIRPQGEAMTLEGPKAFVTPRALETSEVKEIVQQFRQAVKNAVEAGFDGIEIHAANGYLIDQFLRDKTNHRTDEYGGSLENRTRFLLEIIQAAIEVCPAGRIGVRLSPENTYNDIADSNPQQTFNYITEQLSRFGLSFLHIVEADMVDGSRKINYKMIKDRFAGPYIANFGFDKVKAEAAVQSSAADAISFGAVYISNPDLVERFKQDAPLATPDQSTFYGGDEHGYTDYPSLEQEVALA